jgi:hypothetical protein
MKASRWPRVREELTRVPAGPVLSHQNTKDDVGGTTARGSRTSQFASGEEDSEDSELVNTLVTVTRPHNQTHQLL